MMMVVMMGTKKWTRISITMPMMMVVVLVMKAVALLPLRPCQQGATAVEPGLGP